MSGIYIHIPFCRKACHYCNFHFSTSLQWKDEIIGAMVQEITMQKDFFTGPVHTIYFGGGTPSILTNEDIDRLLHRIHREFTVDGEIECTLEANPDDITAEKIKAWKNSGINRLSIGIQSFLDADLQWMNRAHDAKQAMHCVETAVANGIDNLSVDLIYGTPELSNEDWMNNIYTAHGMGIQHLSCYALTVEPDTALEKMILQKKKAPVDANKAAEQMELLMEIAPALGFEHYEISNFAQTGFRSKHNSAYWQGMPYLGIGPSAHSYTGSNADPASRQWNIANNALYIRSIAQKIIPCETEHLTEKQQYNEYIMTSLRTIEGLDLAKTRATEDGILEGGSSGIRKEKDAVFFEKNSLPTILAKAEKFITQGLMVLDNHHLKLTNAGKLRADGIASELFT